MSSSLVSPLGSKRMWLNFETQTSEPHAVLEAPRDRLRVSASRRRRGAASLFPASGYATLNILVAYETILTFGIVERGGL
jgi:hypothetical protein